jgi:hypothetical protein
MARREGMHGLSERMREDVKLAGFAERTQT